MKPWLSNAYILFPSDILKIEFTTITSLSKDIGWADCLLMIPKLWQENIVSSSTQSKLNSQTEHTLGWPEGLVKPQLLSSTVNVPWCLGWYLRICISNKENILIVKIVLFYWLRNILGFCILLMFTKQVKTFFRI